MEVCKSLLEHSSWSVSDPSKMRLVRKSPDFPPEFTRFLGKGITLRAAGVPGETSNTKGYMSREGILDGVENGLIHPETIILEATSGNTGLGMASVCTALGLRFVAIMNEDVPSAKMDAIRVWGRGVRIETHETPVAYARLLGAESGKYNPDQYAGDWNGRAHAKYLAPAVFAGEEISLLFPPSGTMGTYLGLFEYVQRNGLQTRVMPVLCAPDHEVPGVRTLASVIADVRQPWRSACRVEDLQYGTRHAAFCLSFLSWPYCSQPLGPSFGLALTGALRFMWAHKQAGTLDQFRDKDGQIRVVVLGPDDARPYANLYFSELKLKERRGLTLRDVEHLVTTDFR